MRGIGENSPPVGSQPARRDWTAKIVVPVVVGVVGALLVGALTPLGEGLRELLFPTKAAVTGAVLVGDQPAANAHLELDGKDVPDADGDGEFFLVGVGNGAHVLRLEAIGAESENHRFSVERETAEQNLGEIRLNPLVQLGYDVDATPETNLATQSVGLAYDLNLWIIGTPEVMSRIQSVTYTRPDPLSRDPVTRRSSRQSFCYRQRGVLSQEDTLFGADAFIAASASVEFRDGELFHVSAVYAATQDRAPACPTVLVGAGETSGGDTGGGLAGGGGVGGGGGAGGGAGGGDSGGGGDGGGGNGVELVKVPEVSCLTFAQAKNELMGLGLEPLLSDPVAWRPECPDPSRVAQQDTEAGTQVEPGSVVVIHLGVDQSPSP